MEEFRAFYKGFSTYLVQTVQTLATCAPKYYCKFLWLIKPTWSLKDIGLLLIASSTWKLFMRNLRADDEMAKSLRIILYSHLLVLPRNLYIKILCRNKVKQRAPKQSNLAPEIAKKVAWMKKKNIEHAHKQTKSQK